MFSLPLTHRSKTKIATDRTIMLVGAALVFLASPFVAQYIDKNLLYFDSFDNMLLRGDGAAHILYNAGVPATVLRVLCYGYLLSVCVATIAGYLRAIRRRPVFAPIILLVGIAAMIGIFGYSTLLTMLPGLMLVAVLYAPALKNLTGR